MTAKADSSRTEDRAAEAPVGTSIDKFADLTRRILAVPKGEIAEPKKKKARRKSKRRRR